MAAHGHYDYEMKTMTLTVILAWLRQDLDLATANRETNQEIKKQVKIELNSQ